MDGAVRHVPVLRDETLALLDPAGRGVLVDATVGLGGHAEALLLAAPNATLLAIDLDEQNLLASRQRLERFGPRVRFFHADHGELPAVLEAAGYERCDAVLADLGISSNQLDDPQRGLGFSADGPLDMRLDRTRGRTAADLVNGLGEVELANVIYQYGEERYSRRIARAIVERRRGGRIERTDELARLVAGAYPAPAKRTRTGVHPATRTFQALRIAVNDLLGSLERLLEARPGVLAVGGRAAVISFHSLEDRAVKQSFAGWAQSGQAKILTRKPLTPTETEIQANPRSRSAKLRGVERIA